MVKFVIFVAIVTLACVNAQHVFSFAGHPMAGGGPLDLFKNMKVMTPEELMRKQNIKLTSPEELINKQPRSGEHLQVHYMKSESSGDGKMMTSVFHNNNGKKTSYTVTN